MLTQHLLLAAAPHTTGGWCKDQDAKPQEVLPFLFVFLQPLSSPLLSALKPSQKGAALLSHVGMIIGLKSDKRSS